MRNIRAYLAVTIGLLCNTENHTAREIEKSDWFPCKFSTLILYFMESRIMYEVIFPYTQFTFMEFAKKGKFLSVEKLRWQTGPEEGFFSRRVSLSLACPFPLFSPSSPFLSPAAPVTCPSSGEVSIFVLFSFRLWCWQRPGTQHKLQSLEIILVLMR